MIQETKMFLVLFMLLCTILPKNLRMCCVIFNISHDTDFHDPVFIYFC